MTDEQISMELLMQFSPLTGLKRDNLAALARKVQVRELSPGQILFKEGETEKRTYYVLSGILDLQDQGKLVGTVEGGTDAAKNPVAPTSSPRFVADHCNTLVLEASAHSPHGSKNLPLHMAIDSCRTRAGRRSKSDC